MYARYETCAPVRVHFWKGCRLAVPVHLHCRSVQQHRRASVHPDKAPRARQLDPLVLWPPVFRPNQHIIRGHRLIGAVLLSILILPDDDGRAVKHPAMLDRAVRDPRKDLFRRAHEPPREREQMVPIIKDDPAAAALGRVEPPNPAPEGNLPVLPRGSLHAFDPYRQRLSDRACVEQLLGLDQRRVVAEVLEHAHQPARTLRRLDQRIALCNADRHRLLNRDVLARLQRGDAHLCMKMVRRYHLNRIHLRVGQQLPVVSVGLRHLPLCSAPRQHRLVDVADRMKFRFGVILITEVVQVSDCAGADKAYS